ncbi:MAG: hypothetical protein R6U10_04485 [Thermoplasmatota archaeon]
MNKQHVLVVDDEPDIQEILKAYLERMANVVVVSALTGEDGVAKYRELAGRGTPPALVVMDLNLSGSNSDEKIIDEHRSGEGKHMDGVGTAQALFDVDEDAVIWGYTAWSDTAWGDRLREAGAQKVVDRIVSFKEFAGMAASYLGE